MSRAFTLCLLLTACCAYAQRPEADTIQTSDGDITIQPIYHGTLVITWQDQSIYIDPHGGAERFEGLADPTLIFITDIHGDHLDLETLQALNTRNAFFVVPKAVREKLPDEMKQNFMDVPNFDGGSFGGIEFQALPMYNLPESADSRHPKGRGNGYLLFIANKKIYISGDTEDILEMRTLSRVDVAFVCMNLPYTMSVEQAASAVNAFKPEVVYPYHYRGKGGLSDVEKFRNQVNAVSPEVEVRLRNWYSE